MTLMRTMTLSEIFIGQLPVAAGTCETANAVDREQGGRAKNWIDLHLPICHPS